MRARPCPASFSCGGDVRRLGKGPLREGAGERSEPGGVLRAGRGPRAGRGGGGVTQRAHRAGRSAELSLRRMLGRGPQEKAGGFGRPCAGPGAGRAAHGVLPPALRATPISEGGGLSAVGRQINTFSRAIQHKRPNWARPGPVRRPDSGREKGRRRRRQAAERGPGRGCGMRGGQKAGSPLAAEKALWYTPAIVFPTRRFPNLQPPPTP